MALSDRSSSGRRRLAAMTSGAALAALAFAHDARATLPTYLQPGFPLETLDPAPAGDRFVTTPDAAITPFVVSTRAIVDFTSHRRDFRLAGGTLSAPDTNWYGHFGLSTAPCDRLLLGADLPVVIDQFEALQTTEPGRKGLDITPNPLGDVRVGARVRLTPPALTHFAVATSADLWLTTGNVDALTGEPADRFRALLLANGDVSHGAWTFDFAGAAGYQTFTETVGAYGSGRGVPLRAAVGVEHALVGGIHLRGAAEYVGTAWGEPTGGIGRNTGEGLLDLFVLLGQAWTIGWSQGLGFVHSPGVPGARELFMLQYRPVSP
jgi:hypothetical protein